MKILYTSVIVDIRKQGTLAKTHFIEVARNLSKLGDDLLLLVAGYIPRDNTNYGLNVQFIPTGRQRFLSYLWAEFLRIAYFPYAIIKWRPQAVYARKDKFDFFPPIWARIFKIPYFIEVNGIIEDEARMYGTPEWEIRLSKLAERLNYTASRRIICVTSGIKRELIERYAIREEKLVVIPNGVNTELFRPLDKQQCRLKLRLEKDAFYVGFVGSFAPWQGLEIFIEAAKQVKEQRGPQIKYLLVGDGKLEQILRQKIREHKLEQEIQFIGRVAYEEVVYYINAFDVCYLGKEELILAFGFSPLKLFEYLACGRPAIASQVAGVTEVIEEGQCGYLFEPGNAKELAEKILQAYHERSLLNELGKRGRKLVESKYSWLSTAQKIMTVLQQVC